MGARDLLRALTDLSPDEVANFVHSSGHQTVKVTQLARPNRQEIATIDFEEWAVVIGVATSLSTSLAITTLVLKLTCNKLLQTIKRQGQQNPVPENNPRHVTPEV